MSDLIQQQMKAGLAFTQPGGRRHRKSVRPATDLTHYDRYIQEFKDYDINTLQCRDVPEPIAPEGSYYRYQEMETDETFKTLKDAIDFCLGAGQYKHHTHDLGGIQQHLHELEEGGEEDDWGTMNWDNGEFIFDTILSNCQVKKINADINRLWQCATIGASDAKSAVASATELKEMEEKQKQLITQHEADIDFRERQLNDLSKENMRLQDVIKGEDTCEGDETPLVLVDMMERLDTAELALKKAVADAKDEKDKFISEMDDVIADCDLAEAEEVLGKYGCCADDMGHEWYQQCLNEGYNDNEIVSIESWEEVVEEKEEAEEELEREQSIVQAYRDVMDQLDEIVPELKEEDGGTIEGLVDWAKKTLKQNEDYAYEAIRDKDAEEVGYEKGFEAGKEAEKYLPVDAEFMGKKTQSRILKDSVISALDKERGELIDHLKTARDNWKKSETLHEEQQKKIEVQQAVINSQKSEFVETHWLDEEIETQKKKLDVQDGVIKSLQAERAITKKAEAENERAFNQNALMVIEKHLEGQFAQGMLKQLLGDLSECDHIFADMPRAYAEWRQSPNIVAEVEKMLEKPPATLARYNSL